MKKVKFMGAIVIGLFFICSGCPDNDIAELNDCNLEKVVKSITDLKGTIWYDTQSLKYSVFTGVEGTYDSQDIGILCNLPDKYKVEGLNILSSENYCRC